MKMTLPGEFGPDVSAQRVADLLRARAPRGTQIDEGLGIANRNLHAPPPASQESLATDRLKVLNLDGPSTCLKFFSDTLNFAIPPSSPPSLGKPPQLQLEARGVALDLPAGSGKYGWFPLGKRDSGPPLGNALAKTLFCTGWCIYPSFWTQSMAAENFELRGTLRTRMLARNKTVAPSRNPRR